MAGAVLVRDGDSRPFVGDAGNLLYVRLRLGAALHAGPGARALMTLRLPPGYACRAAAHAPEDLATLAATADGGPQGRGELLDGVWTYSGGDCSYRPAANAALYAGGSLLVALTVDNPPRPLPEKSLANIWSVALTGQGDLLASASPLALEGVETIL